MIYSPFAKIILRSDLYYNYKNNLKNAWNKKYQKFVDLENHEN